jgi:hypothetical protein
MEHNVMKLSIAKCLVIESRNEIDSGYHVTELKNVSSILRDGLKTNMGNNDNWDPQNKDKILDYYKGSIPIFLGLKPWFKRWNKEGMVVMKIIDVPKEKIDIDMPLFLDYIHGDIKDENIVLKEHAVRNSYYDKKVRFDFQKFNNEISNLMNVGTVNYYDDWKIPLSMISGKVALEIINLTGTFACVENISSEKIELVTDT